MTVVVPGKGLMATQRTEYINGVTIQVTELGIADYEQGLLSVRMLDSYPALEGQVLVSDGNGCVEWKDPFDGDKDLREKYPALEESWDILMEALEEYQLVKKLVQDHDK